MTLYLPVGATEVVNTMDHPYFAHVHMFPQEKHLATVFVRFVMYLPNLRENS